MKDEDVNASEHAQEALQNSVLACAIKATEAATVAANGLSVFNVCSGSEVSAMVDTASAFHKHVVTTFQDGQKFTAAMSMSTKGSDD